MFSSLFKAAKAPRLSAPMHAQPQRAARSRGTSLLPVGLKVLFSQLPGRRGSERRSRRCSLLFVLVGFGLLLLAIASLFLMRHVRLPGLVRSMPAIDSGPRVYFSA